ncbi:MAG: hypothetical protein KIT24_02000 [Phycisphaeraceae bacterium]|nr:hypothetical protein [Phycisphaeraceae bacterium]
MEVQVVRRLETAGVPELRRLGAWATRAAMPLEGRHRDQPWGLFSTHNLLAGAVPALPQIGITCRIVAWSGWLPEDASPEQGVFFPGHSTWMGAGWAGLVEVCRWLGPALEERGMRLCLRPHARHVLSDASSCLKFVREEETLPVDVVLEPAALLTHAMLAEAKTHLERIVGALGAHARVVGILASNVEVVTLEDRGPELRTTPLMSGVLDPEWVAAPIRALGAEARSVLLYEEGLPRQLSLIRPAGRA